jgi:2'-5' RNA ligase
MTDERGERDVSDLAADPEAFWERRHDLSVRPTTDADVAAREGGDRLVALFDLPTPTGDRFDPTLDRLREFDALAVVPRRYLHVTVTEVGRVVDDPDGPGEVAPGGVADLADAVGRALAGAERFEVRFPRLGLFPTVVYAAVDDGGRFGALNDRVRSLDAVPVAPRDESFVPHATVAQFREERVEAVVAALERDRRLGESGPGGSRAGDRGESADDGVPSVAVDAVDLVRVDPTERFPRFERVRRYPLD